MSRGVADFFFHPLTFRHRVNNFIGQQVYSPGGLKPTGEVGNGLFAAGFHGTLIFLMPNLILKNHGPGKVHIPVFPKNFLISYFLPVLVRTVRPRQNEGRVGRRAYSIF